MSVVVHGIPKIGMTPMVARAQRTEAIVFAATRVAPGEPQTEAGTARFCALKLQNSPSRRNEKNWRCRPSDSRSEHRDLSVPAPFRLF